MEYNNSIRKLSKGEARLLDLLIKKASIMIAHNLEDLLVKELDDGGMGSLSLLPKGISEDDRLFGEQISEYMFKDEDGVNVIASLNVDKSGNLFELDMWKTDFSPLIKIPEVLN